MEKKEEKKVCCICGKEYEGYGYNPFPVKEEACCCALEKLTGQDEWRQKLREELRRKRSVCLKLMQQLGIDTTDWNRVNEFCNNPRIAGKPFVQISTAELEQLAIKLRAIQRKGGLTDK